MNFVDRFPLSAILAWTDAHNIDITTWKTWGDTAPEFVSNAAMHRLYNILNAQMPDQPLGLRMGSECKLDTLGLFGQIGQHCETMRDGVEVYIRYQRFSPPGNTRVELDTDHCAIVVASGSDLSIADSMDFRMGFAFAQTLSIFRQMLGDPSITVKFVEFAHENDRFHDQYETYFGGPVTFGHDENRIAFSGEIVDRAVAGAVPSTRTFLEELAISKVTRHTAANAPSQDFVEVLRADLKELILAGDFDEATIARRFSISPRTMQRRLAAQNLAFRELVDEIRAQLAMELLAKPEFTIQEIAAKLGYTQASSFHRAFKRWTGQTPSEVRCDLLV